MTCQNCQLNDYTIVQCLEKEKILWCQTCYAFKVQKREDFDKAQLKFLKDIGSKCQCGNPIKIQLFCKLCYLKLWRAEHKPLKMIYRSKAKRQREEGDSCCENCGETNGADHHWRSGPDDQIFCNACGLKYRRLLNK